MKILHWVLNALLVLAAGANFYLAFARGIHGLLLVGAAFLVFAGVFTYHTLKKS